MSKFHVGDRVRVTLGAGSYDTGEVISTDVSGWDYKVRTDANGIEYEVIEEELRPADIYPQNDSVSRPTHYTQGMPEGVEVIDIIRAQDAGFEHANVIKYILRWKYKNGVEDLKKAQQYLQWLIEKEANK